MKPDEIDALVTMIKQAIDSKFEKFRDEFEREQKRSLILVAKSAVKTDAELWAKEMTARLEKAVTELPQAEAGKDGESATQEQVNEAVAKYLTENPIEASQEAIFAQVSKYLIDNPPQAGKDGLNGSNGLDAMQIEILPSIDAEKRYPRGTYARYKGGVIRAVRDTDAGEPMQSGWEVLINGVDNVEIHQLQGGEFAIKTILSNGQSNIVKAALPTMEYKGVWKESNGEYSKGHTVTHQGSLWHCNKSTTDKPSTSDAWTLCTKAGRDGKDLSVVKLEKPQVIKL
jgi:vacuolar-type H+-ATPase subunit F/Vma7